MADDELLSQEEIDSLVQQASAAGAAEPPGAEVQNDSAGATQTVPVHTGRGGCRGIDLIMDVQLNVAVELGRTRMNVRDVLALGPGSVVELDKHAGEPVEVVVNDKVVARGEVVVIDESFGVRITEIVGSEEQDSYAKAA